MNSTAGELSPPSLHRVAAFVAIGGGIGAVARLALTMLLPAWEGGGLPLATLLANILACLLLGYLLGIFRSAPIPEEVRQLGTSGFCGGFSTFSTFTSETLTLLERGNPYLAAAYSGGSVMIGMLAVVGGIAASTLRKAPDG